MFEADDWCCTEAREDSKFTYMWTIKNFNASKYPRKRGEYLDSSTFSTLSSKHEERKWCLRLYPGGVEQLRHQYNRLGLYLVLISGQEVSVTYKFFIINENGEKESYWGVDLPETFAINTEKQRSGTDRFIEFYSTKPDGTYCKNDCLNILCEITIVTFQHTSEGGHKLEDSVYYYPNDLGRLLLDNQEHCDVILQVNEQDFRAHKAVLAARSPVFAAMFQNEMEEKNQNKVVIPDMTTDTVVQMLRFIYTGKVVDMTNVAQSETSTTITTTMANQLLKAADKYQLEVLMKSCEKGIATNLNIDTAAEILILADLHNSTGLKQQAIDFIKCNREEVKKTEGWKNMTQTYPKLVLDAVF